MKAGAGAGGATGLRTSTLTKQRQGEHEVGAVIMLGTLFGLIVLVFVLVRRYDPAARPAKRRDGE
jgi:hypothetical protein